MYRGLLARNGLQLVKRVRFRELSEFKRNESDLSFSFETEDSDLSSETEEAEGVERSTRL